MYVNSYMSGEPVIAASVRRQLTHEILPTVTTAELSRIVTQSLSDTNRVFSAFAPSSDSAGLPTPQQLLAAYTNGLSAHTTAYVDRTVDDAPLLATLPKAGTVTTEVRDSTTGVVTWTLSNGIRVLVKQTNFAPNTVSISGSRKGGTSLVPDSLLIPAATAVDVGSAGGMYSPQVQAQLGDTPHPAYQFVIQFSADPARLPELQKVVLAVVDTLRMHGPTASELEKLKEESLRGWETAVKDNRFWLAMITQYVERGWPLAGIPTANQYTQSLTAAQVQAAARQFLDTSNYMQFSLYPEKR
jgi:hypothetical protein